MVFGAEFVLQRLTSLLLLLTFAGSTIGLPLPMSATASGVCDAGCQCSAEQRNAGTCCCTGEAASQKSCCQFKTKASCCSKKSSSKKETPSIASRCGCGDEFPGLLTNGGEPRLTGNRPTWSPSIHQIATLATCSDRLSSIAHGPDEPVPRPLAG
ncbi:MAG: hypothetical protein KDA93_10835 [Planctomycetaceae bacterium]|nr:hypothetical protein [Planctomycetaceae bacterium]